MNGLLSGLYPVCHALCGVTEEMLRYNPNVRISAADALLDDYFLTQPLPAKPSAVAELVM
jgi:cytochrome P450